MSGDLPFPEQRGELCGWTKGAGRIGGTDSGTLEIWKGFGLRLGDHGPKEIRPQRNGSGAANFEGRQFCVVRHCICSFKIHP